MAAIYASKLDPNSGRLSVNIRTVLAAIIVKHRLKMSDRETIDSISENLYLQFFAGYSSFSTRPPFDASLFVDIRKRLGVEQFDKMTCLLLKQVEQAEQQAMNLFKDKLTICAQSIATVDFSYFLPRTFQVCGKNRASSTVTSLHARLANLSLNKFHIKMKVRNPDFLEAVIVLQWKIFEMNTGFWGITNQLGNQPAKPCKTLG